MMTIKKALAALTLIMLALPSMVEAQRPRHWFECQDCHRSGKSFYALSDNLCLLCHEVNSLNVSMMDGTDIGAAGRFITGDASDAMGTFAVYNSVPAAETSHMWAGPTDSKPEAGASPPTLKIDGRYGISRGKVTCARCHDPHAWDTVPAILKTNNEKDRFCKDCHRSWNTSDPDALLSHPMVADYNAAVLADPAKLNASYNSVTGRLDANVNNGDVSLVYNSVSAKWMVSCSTCHGVHYTDSDAATDDGIYQQSRFSADPRYTTGLNTGDGKLLRSDGAKDPGGLTSLQLAQKRSNLCQACHTYQLHGKAGNIAPGSSADEFVGCLDCHGGHSYNNGDPNYYILRSTYNTVAYGPVSNVVYNSLPTPWTDGLPTSANGYCERCHGSGETITGGLRDHTAGEDCSGCHAHNTDVYSFAMGDNAAICGDCHGAPPRDNSLPIRGDLGIETGVGADAGGYSYLDDPNYKSELTTPHKTHAGGQNADAAATDYVFGSGGVLQSCLPCHNDQPDTVTQTHDTGDSTGSFQDIYFSDFSTYTGVLTPGAYNPGNPANGQCSGIYCHSNGGKRREGGKILADFVTATTPAWLNGKGAIVGETSPTHECAFCHGNNETSMAAGQKNNSPAHIVHISSTGYAFACHACHADTVDASGVVPSTARDMRTGGKHVNGVADVSYPTSGSVLYNSLTASAYNAGSGTCSTYCHSPGGTGTTPDWDITGGMTCTSCHNKGSDTGVLADSAPNDTSHAKHLTDPNGPQLNSCTPCHGGTDIGDHTGHVNGAFDALSAATTCDACHGYTGGISESQPIWGETPYNSAPVDEGYCITCHTGTVSSFNNGTAHTAPDKTAALTTGHNYNSVTPYTSGNASAKLTCDDCHDVAGAGHFDAPKTDKRLKLNVNGFPAVYNSTTANAFCDACHGGASPPNPEAGAKVNINTHQVKNCVACHDVHGDSNIFMVKSVNTTDYSGTVTFLYNSTGIDSYDEDDGAVGPGDEANADDICATCHTQANQTSPKHNNRENLDETGSGHNLGADCFQCHNAHTDGTDAFGGGAGTKCDDCHGYPPSTGAHGNGTNLHTRVVSVFAIEDYPTEERSDCAYCHTGADSYTYAGEGDQPGLNHGNDAGRINILFNSIGFSNNGTPLDNTDDTCAGACHASTLADGAWGDANGLACTSCHGYTSASGTPIVTSSHNAHVVSATKACADCHGAEEAPGPGVLTHINIGAGADDAAKIVDRATAAGSEAGVTPTGMNWVSPTCTSTGDGLGCHATGSASWGSGPQACTSCHSNTTNTNVNPTSGLHGNTTAPSVTGESHDDSFGSGYNCVTCHTSNPSLAHANATLNAYPTVNLNSAVVTNYNTTLVPRTCTATCHTAGTSWAYRWTTDVYNSLGGADIRECSGCHGTYGSGWTNGVIHTENPSRGSGHNTKGSLDYPCTDCHAIGAGTGVYNWTSAWGGASSHGDGNLQVNYNSTFFAETGTGSLPTDRAYCNNGTCHGQANHDFPVSLTFGTQVTVTGDEPQISCGGCHGGDITFGDDVNYWPDGGAYLADDQPGRHQAHMAALAMLVYGETATGAGGNDLLRNTVNGDPKTKQQALCDYCHDINDGTHGQEAQLPADLNGVKMLNGTVAGVADGGAAFGWNAVNWTCSNTDCHNERVTTAGTYGWYDAGTTACAMCHNPDDVVNAVNPGGVTHTAHTGAATNFGRPITCDNCHKTATETVTWGSPGTAPANNHINNTLNVTGTVSFTYNSVTLSCGTNECHNAGDGVTAPATGTYPWGGALANCTICHLDPPTTGAHTPHMNNTTYVACADCHTPASNGAHIGGSVTYNTVTVSAYNGGTGTCTNTCHAGSPSDWRDSVPTVGCTDCHGGTYVGGDNTGTGGANYLPQYQMHTVTPVTSGKVHTDTGLGTACTTCHDSLPASGGSHVNGLWETDTATNAAGQTRGMFASYSEAASGSSTCATACHTAGTNWAYRWNASAGVNDETRCANCHGYWSDGADGSGWRSGVSHAENQLRGHTGTHNDGADLNFGYECYRCHALGDSLGVYKWTDGTNDWDPTDGLLGSTQHGDDLITMNYNGVTANDHNIGGRSGCTNCHEGAVEVGGDGNTHDFPASAFAQGLVNGDPVTGSGGGCDGCHGSGGSYAPDASRGYAWPDRPGKHAEHMAALTAKGIAQTDACTYCHPYPAGESTYVIGVHNDAGGPATMPSPPTTKFKRIIGGGDDTDGIYNSVAAEKVTCNTVDCHFNMPTTPHWYDDIYPPAAVALTAQPGPEPRSIRVQWLAPGDDDNVADTTAYVYDLRMSNSSILSGAAYNSATVVGGLPATYKQNYNSVVLVENLDPLQTYHFSLKTRDTAGNLSPYSPGDASATPTADTAAPDFGGADKAVPGDDSATVDLYWTPAEDHSMPITYKVWMKAESAGTLDMNVDAPILTGVTDSKISLTNGGIYYLQGPITVVNDTIYHFGVRACDGNGVCDTNTQTVSATPTDVSPVDKSFPTYKTDGSTTLQVIAGDPVGPPVTGAALPIVFAGSDPGFAVDYFVDTFYITLVGSNSAAGQVRVDVGYSNGINFFPRNDKDNQPIFKIVDVAKRANRVFSFKIVNLPGLALATGERLAIQLSEVAPLVGITASYGDGTARGDLTVAERIVNNPPAPQANPGSASLPAGSAVVDIQWDAYTDGTDGLADTVHYDLYGSDDDGASYEYLIATGLDAATTSYQWNTQLAGIESGTLKVLLKAGDTYAHTSQPITVSGGTADANDYVAPSAIDDLVARARPKAGTVWLTWTSPGDDLDNHGRADHYEVRYRTDVAVSDGNWVSSTLVSGAPPSPDFGGKIQHMEVVDLTPGDTYYFGVKTFDEVGNASAVSTAKSPGSDQEAGGPRCGMCHTTAPSVDESVGNHKLHGFTLYDCDKCHTQDAGATKPSNYGLDHQDGTLKMGFGPLGAFQGYISGNRIYYTSDGNPDSGNNVIYDDTDGFGGFGAGDYVAVGDFTDNGNCFRWGALGVGGCHGPAGSDPDGGGTTPYPTYPTPNWNAAWTLDCAACHGNPNRGATGPDRMYDPYSREYDATNDNGGVTPDQILGSPAVDNHGKYDPAAALAKDRKYIGQHEKHLNYSFRFSKGDSCNLCHEGEYADRDKLDGRHANGEIDVQLDPVGAGEEAYFTPNYNGVDTPGACFSLSDLACHPASTAEGGSAPVPKWDSSQNFDCVQCHGFDGTTPSHVTDPAGGVLAPDNGWATDPMAGNCTYCHFGGHPLDDLGGTAIILPNSSQVGLEFRSGGIHMKKTIGGRTASYEAEICWNCHNAQTPRVSEWGADDWNPNTATDPGNGTNYNYGQLMDASYTSNVSTWSTGYWKSAEANFDYKKAAIQSTHTTSETANAVNAYNSVSPVGSPLAGSDFAYTEAPDADNLIRCSNCHDVHNRNMAPGDNPTGNPLLDGPPYLRGSWKRNPYKEDGAPWNKAYAVTNANFGAVPRAGGPGGDEMGGYQIDQNNGSPTAGWSLATSAGICTLCHGTDVDKMDRYEPDGVTPDDGVNLWVGTGGNGHSNATLGGTASKASNIFGHGIGGRPAPNAQSADESQNAGDVFDMALQSMFFFGKTASDYGTAYRGTQYDQGFIPGIYRPNAFADFKWGVTVDDITTDIGYHAFTCSKCHNPHASRLPKLMITNCLDTKHSTWDTGANGANSQTLGYWTSPADNGEMTSTWNTAQNCHRYDNNDSVGGWNKVTPW